MADLEGTAEVYGVFVDRSYCLKFAAAIGNSNCFLQFFTKSA